MDVTPELPAMGPRIGSQVPALVPELGTSSGPSFFLFADDSCGSCIEVVPEFGKVADMARRNARQEGGIEASFTVLLRGPSDGFVRVPDLELRTHQARLFGQVGIAITPYLVAVDERGIVRLSAAVGSVERLIGAVQTGLSREVAYHEHIG